MSRIVVGIDSSSHAVAALKWAIEEAKLRGVAVELVHAYPTAELTAMPTIVTLPSDEELRAGAEATMAEALEQAGGADGVDVTFRAQAGGAVGVLTDAARDALLLVIGARGLGGFRGLLLGSVSQQAVAHSPVPVVVVPPRHD